MVNVLASYLILHIFTLLIAKILINGHFQLLELSNLDILISFQIIVPYVSIRISWRTWKFTQLTSLYERTNSLYFKILAFSHLVWCDSRFWYFLNVDWGEEKLSIILIGWCSGQPSCLDTSVASTLTVTVSLMLLVSTNYFRSGWHADQPKYSLRSPPSVSLQCKLVRIPFATVSMLGHFHSLHIAPVHSAV